MKADIKLADLGNDKLPRFFEGTINLSYLNTRPHGINGALINVVGHVQIFLDSCFTFGLNPLQHLRHSAQIRWRFEETEEYVSAILGRALHREADFVFGCGNGVVMALCEHRVSETVLVLPSDLDDEHLRGGPLEKIRSHGRTRMLRLANQFRIDGLSYEVIHI